MAPPSGLRWSLLTSSHPALPVTLISPDHLGGDVRWEWPTPRRPSSQFQVHPLALPQLHLIMRKTRRRRDQWYETSQIIFLLFPCQCTQTFNYVICVNRFVGVFSFHYFSSSLFVKVVPDTWEYGHWLSFQSSHLELFCTGGAESVRKGVDRHLQPASLH